MNYVASSDARGYHKDQHHVVQPCQGNTRKTEEHPCAVVIVVFIHGHGHLQGLHGGILRHRTLGGTPNNPPPTTRHKLKSTPLRHESDIEDFR